MCKLLPGISSHVFILFVLTMSWNTGSFGGLPNIAPPGFASGFSSSTVAPGNYLHYFTFLFPSLNKVYYFSRFFPSYSNSRKVIQLVLSYMNNKYVIVFKLVAEMVKVIGQNTKLRMEEPTTTTF